MKTTLLVLFLTGAGLWAQPAATPPVVPDTTTNVTPNADADREEVLRQALRDALGGKTNIGAPLIAQNPPTNAVGGIPALPTRAVRPPASRTNSIALPSSAPGAAMTPAAAPSIPAIPTATVPPSTTPAVIPVADQAVTLPAPGTPAPVPASSTIPAPDEIIPAGVINFQGVDIDDVLKIYAELVQRTILRPATLPAPKVFLRTQTALTKREAVQALDAVLGMNGIAMVNVSEKFVKAVATPNAAQAGAPWNKQAADQFPDIGPYVTHVVQLKVAKPSEMVAALQPFASPIANPILPIDSSQILVLRDFTENVKRMLELIAEIDVPVSSEYVSEVIPIKYALASEIASALNSLSSGGGGTSVGGGARGGSGARTGGSGFGRQGGTGAQGSYPGQTQPGAFNQPGTTGQTPGTGSSFTDRLQNIIKKASATGDIQVIGQTKIIADERTNSLLIFASKDDMKMIKDIVGKLDVVLAQVLIEAVIIEVDVSNGKDLGISYLQRPKTSGNLTGIGAIGKPFYTPGDFLPGSGTNTGAALNGGFSYLAQWNQDLDVAITAVANDSRARVLQRPRIQTSHAVQATLFVGESRPYPTASYYGGGSFGGYSSIQQLQIGVTLDVTPLINPDGLVVMDIHQTIESANGSVNIVNVGDVPITSRKEAAAKVAVRDHDTIILGGLIETDKTKNGSGVPFLMDIPLLGYLFRSTSTTEVRKELIVLIRPTVLPTPEIAALTATAEKNKMPGVRSTENEIMEEDNKRLKEEDKVKKHY